MHPSSSMSQDDLPPYVQKMFDEAYKHPSGTRARQTEIINMAFNKQKGRWKLDLTKPLFQEENAKYEKKFATDEQEAIPRMLMAERFKDGDEGVERMIRAGFVCEIENDVER